MVDNPPYSVIPHHLETFIIIFPSLFCLYILIQEIFTSSRHISFMSFLFRLQRWTELFYLSFVFDFSSCANCSVTTPPSPSDSSALFLRPRREGGGGGFLNSLLVSCPHFNLGAKEWKPARVVLINLILPFTLIFSIFFVSVSSAVSRAYSIPYSILCSIPCDILYSRNSEHYVLKNILNSSEPIQNI